MPSRLPVPSLDDLESVASELDDDDHFDKQEKGDVSKSASEVSRSATGTDTGDEKLHIAKRETVAVNRLRALVFFVLFLAALTVCIIVYKVTKSADNEAYRKQYEGAARKVTDAFLDIMETKMAAATTMTVAMTAYAKDHGNPWPFVTLPDFQPRSATARKQSGALYFHVNPLVTNATRKEWENEYVVGNDSYWIQEGLDYQDGIGLFDFKPDEEVNVDEHSARTEEYWPIWGYPPSDSSDDGSEDEDEEDEDEDDRRHLQDDHEGEDHEDEDEDDSDDDANGAPQIAVSPEEMILMPTWQTSPIIHYGHEVNENVLTAQDKGGPYAAASFATGNVVLSHFEMTEDGAEHSKLLSTLLSVAKQKSYDYTGSPISTVYFPIFDVFGEDRKPAAVMGALVHWTDFFEDVLPSNVEGIVAVLHTTCEGDDDDDPTSYTFGINGEEVVDIGKWDLHDSKYDDMEQKASFSSIDSISDGTKLGISLNQDLCVVSIHVYPSDRLADAFNTNTPVIMTTAVALVFVFAAFMFLVYDRLVEYRQKLVLSSAERTNKIVTSLFPANVRDRLMNQDNIEKPGSGFSAPNSRRLKGYLNGNDAGSSALTTSDDPIADLFPQCTVLFADISGFTAWSSTREPRQVFILLQTLYEAFDKVAKRRRVFKVETIGDSYVAVTGLPEPQPSHAMIMALFAGECKIKMNELVARLESSLGPDTGDLSMRFGLHSGPVTAGVLRGERARFQLFGDTVNTAARMESTGMRNKIQCSKATYNALSEAGKGSWLHPREDQVEAKGKGMMQTWWLDPTLRRGSTATNTTASSMSDSSERNAIMLGPAITRLSSSAGVGISKKDNRLVNWIVDLLQENIRKLVATRAKDSRVSGGSKSLRFKARKDATSLDEVVEKIAMPDFDAKHFVSPEDARKVNIDPEITAQLHALVTAIASMYKDNPFHNFEHACHVTMATDKFLKRIVAPDIEGEDDKMASDVHTFTHGINSSDPLLLLGILFSALIHDADHRGISNGQLAVEDTEMAAKYRNKSIAEQNSLDLAWDLLMQHRFSDLRRCLFTSQSELLRFRQVVVNVVLATDIFDKELNDLRKNRWNQAFAEENLVDGVIDHDLRATIVLEHIIQASDVSHTMQHWHIYRKWNARLFQELYTAYKEGRMAKDPSTFWYQGELGFFDNYVIPLARKLKECRVFGVGADECLDYATQNRNEWKERGQQIVTEMQLDAASKIAHIEEEIAGVEERGTKNADFNASVISC